MPPGAATQASRRQWDAFDYVAFSHMHFDHVGVANELVGGTLLIQRGEYEAAFDGGTATPGFDPKLYERLRKSRTQILNGDHDVFGDGLVRIIAAAGYTPGHQVLFVRLGEAGPIVLSGDLYHFAVSREQRRVPPFNSDADQTTASMQRVESLLEETGRRCGSSTNWPTSSGRSALGWRQLEIAGQQRPVDVTREASTTGSILSPAEPSMRPVYCRRSAHLKRAGSAESEGLRAIGCRDGDVLRLVSLHLDHDSADKR